MRICTICADDSAAAPPRQAIVSSQTGIWYIGFMSDVLARLSSALENRYRVDREVGVGGMATVFLAHDVRHDRDVAIKVLHPDLAAALGAERFLVEIKTTAKLQHPHILALLDSGDADGLLYYVMPYVAGESLRARLERETQLAVDDAVRIAREVASALDYAHRNGVVHRDVKPENILIHEDQALVADFGISLAVSAAGGPRMTQTGLSLGTPAYMAPEQAMGERAIDGRADIYALGAVLYEMLVGEAPFTGPTVQAIVARVMTESPRPVTGQRRSVPDYVNAAVLRSLEKLPADRFHTAAEFSQALGSPSFQAQATSGRTRDTQGKRSTLWGHPLLPWVVAGVAVLTAGGFALRGGASDEVKSPAYLAVDLPQSMGLPPFNSEMLAITDDGSTLAIGVTVGGQTHLVLRRIGEDALTIVNGSMGASGSAAFSSDGKWLAFVVDRRIFKTPVRGGPATPIGTASWGQLAWVGSSAIILTNNYDTGLSRISAEGGDSVVLTTPDRKKKELGHWWPQALADGEHVLFTNYTTPADRSRLEVLSLKSGKRTVIQDGGYFGRYANGRLFFVRNGALMSVPFDAKSLKVSGSPSASALDIETNPPNGWGGFAVASNGTIAYRTDALKSVELSWADEGGNEIAAIDSAGRYTEAVPSPDGSKVALVRDGEVWVYDIRRKLFSRLTRSEQLEENIVWMPDSKSVFYSRDVPQFDVFHRVADGSRPEEIVMTSGYDKEASSVSPDGSTLLYRTDPEGDGDVYAYDLGQPAGGKPRKIIGGAGTQSDAQFSPDGQWIAYTSDESGRIEVYLVPYPTDRGPARLQLSDGGGQSPKWGADGRTVYFGWAGRIQRTRINPRTGESERAEILSRIQPTLGWTTASPGRFLIARIAKDAERHSIKVVLNWTTTLGNGAR